MLCIMQVEIGGFDLLRSDPWFELVKLSQQGGDLPCLRADEDVVEAEAEEHGVGEVLPGFIDQRVCHIGTLGVRLGYALEDVGWSHAGVATRS